MGKRDDITPEEGEHIREELSAYIDGALGGAEYEAARLHLEGCAVCRAEHDDLLATRDLLRSVPMMAPPRAFTLTQEMIAPAQERVGFWGRLLAPRNAPRMALGSALSFALAVMLLLGSFSLMSREKNFPSQALMTETERDEVARLMPAEGYSSYIEATPGFAAGELPPQANQGVAAPTVTSLAMTGAASEPTLGATPRPADAAVTSMAQADSAARAEASTKALETPQAGSSEGSMQSLPTQGAPSVGAQAALTPTLVARGYNPERDASGLVQPSGAPESEASTPTEDQRGGSNNTLFFSLVVLFMALAVALGAGAAVARRRA